MVHASVRSLGPVTGGVNVIVQALFEAVGSTDTLCAYVDFEPFFEDGDEDGVPVFDKRVAHAARDHGVLHETLRNWPGALRSDHPDEGVVAIGPLGEWITRDHPFQYGYGTGVAAREGGASRWTGADARRAFGYGHVAALRGVPGANSEQADPAVSTTDARACLGGF